jgi:probable HAF family extracellular repeat protein
MTKRTSLFCMKPTKAVALVALLVASAVTQGVLAAEYAVTDLGPLSRGESYAAGVNESGQLVGEFDTGSNSNFHGFLYNGGTMTDLGTLGGTHSVAYGINAAGQVVGRSQIPGDGAYHAFLYSDGTMIDLNDLVPADVTVTHATGINAAGQIVADGRIGGSAHARALLLTPIVLDRFAYALVDVSTTGSDTPDSRYAYNAAGGAIRITQPGVGLYDVAFDSLPAWGPGLSSAVAVTAYGSSPITCSVVGYDRASPSRTVAHVGCFDVAAQRMADSPFTILVVGNQSLPVNSAFVRSGGPAPVPRPDPAGSWTSIPDRWPDVDHNGPPGDYNVRLGTGNTQMSAKLVTGTTGVGTHCNHARSITGGLRV